MCSITPPAAGPVAVPAFSAAVEHAEQVVAAVAEALADPERFDLGGLPADQAAGLTTALLALADRATAAATVLAGQVTATTGPGAGTLIAGRYASPRRWLEVEAGLSVGSAKAVLARARDLREHSGIVQQAWLAGEVSGDAVRTLTSGITGALKPVSATREEKGRLRAEAIEVLLPVAQAGTVADLGRAVGRLRLLAESSFEDPDREAERAQAAFDAYDDQALTCVQVGDHSIITATLTHEGAAAAMTVIDQHARRIADRGTVAVHDPACPLAPAAAGPASAAGTWCTCGASASSGVVSTANWPHLRAVAFGELMTAQLDEGRVGSHHGIAPHVTVQVTLDQLHAGLGGELAMPGSDERVLLSSLAVRRILCDADITPVVVEQGPPTAATPDTDSDAEDPAAPDDPAPAAPEDDRARLSRLLMATAVTVLYVGRAQRTAPPRLRRALEARDRHCVFPGCRAHPRRCQAHHVHEWEHGGPTDLDSMALLCVRHHHAVHEGGWTITRAAGTHPHQTGCWTLAPPIPRP